MEKNFEQDEDTNYLQNNSQVTQISKNQNNFDYNFSDLEFKEDQDYKDECIEEEL